jgi:large subunit ribosomal protein L30
MANKQKQLQVKLLPSTNGRLVAHKACVKGLGLRRIGQHMTLPDTPAVRGMIKKVAYLLAVEET